MKTPLTSRTAPNHRAFTLLEVMIAVVIFCTASFAILALVSQSIENLHRLERPMIDSGLVAAAVYSNTNSIIEQPESGNLADLLGDAYKGYTWDTGNSPTEVQTNKLYQVDITIRRDDANRSIVSQGSYLFYKPNSPAGSLDGATVTR